MIMIKKELRQKLIIIQNAGTYIKSKNLCTIFLISQNMSRYRGVLTGENPTPPQNIQCCYIIIRIFQN